MNKESYVKLLRSVILDERLSAMDLKIYCYLRLWTPNTATNSTIMKDLNIKSIKTLQKSLQHLKLCGWIDSNFESMSKSVDKYHSVRKIWTLPQENKDQKTLPPGFKNWILKSVGLSLDVFNSYDDTRKEMYIKKYNKEIKK